ncbi:MAG: hypothetical protein IJU35_05850 [Paludibacteraceae bacterium]|nr:hypothetical protein [Paludibacteraceae bacterium]
MLSTISLIVNALVAVALAVIKSETTRLRKEVRRLRQALKLVNNCQHKQQCPVIKNLSNFLLNI